jgi:hypothetical protein
VPRRAVGAAGGLAVVATLMSGSVAEAASFNVTSTGDTGAGTLRQAITDANLATGPNAILFQSGLSGSIDLASDLPVITQPVTITGPGARTLTVNGHAHRIFSFDFGTLTSPPDTISGLTLSGGSAVSGGAVYSHYPTLALNDVTISGNHASSYGGGVDTVGTLAVSDSTISGNTAASGDGGIAAGGGLTVQSSTVEGNTATANGGGGIEVGGGALAIQNSTISGNTAPGNGNKGGGINIGTSVTSASIQNTIVARNTAGNSGPDIFTSTSAGHPVPTASFSFIGDKTGSGITLDATDQTGFVALGPLENNGGPTDTMMPRLDSLVVDKGKAFGAATLDQRGLTRPVDLPGIPNASGGDGTDIGAVEIQTSEAAPATYTVTNTNDSGPGSFRDALGQVNPHPGQNTILFESGLSGSINLASSLPAINSPLTITGPGARTLTINGNGHELLAFSYDRTSSPPDQVTGLTLTGGAGALTPNGGGPYGGAVYSGSQPLVLDGVTISGNHANYGGGVYTYGHLTIADSTISGNMASNSAGGVNAAYGLDLRSSTVAGNTAADGDGGGIRAGSSALLITGSTISGNHAFGSGNYGKGGGISLSNVLTSAALDNTIVSGNTASGLGPDIFTGTGAGAVVPTASFSLIGNNSASRVTPDSTDITGKDPLLGPLQNNGGPTDTMLPADTSPVIDQGKAFGATLDQRGLTRPVDLGGFPNATGGDGSDIGAVELQLAEVLPTISALSAMSGVAGTSVVITGTDLTGATQVLFGSAKAQFTVNSDTKITATAPAGTGSVDVRVISLNGESAAVAADKFTYTVIPPPTQMTTGSVGDQQLVLTTPSASTCTPVAKGLGVTFSSTSKSKTKQLKFSSASFYVDKGIKHTRKRKRHHKRITVVTYTPNAVVHHVPSTLTLKLTGDKSGSHTLKVVAAYKKSVTKHHRKVTITVTKTLKVKFTIC